MVMLEVWKNLKKYLPTNQTFGILQCLQFLSSIGIILCGGCLNFPSVVLFSVPFILGKVFDKVLVLLANKWILLF